MRFLTLFRPDTTTTNAAPADRDDTMIEYARRSQEAGVLVSQAMLGPEATEITLDGDRFSTKELEGEAMGYAYIEAESFADAVRHVKEFLQVAGGGRTVIRQVMDADAGRGA